VLLLPDYSYHRRTINGQPGPLYRRFVSRKQWFSDQHLLKFQEIRDIPFVHSSAAN
jgi:hypothetical protein